jgi:hypothetical protein
MTLADIPSLMARATDEILRLQTANAALTRQRDALAEALARCIPWIAKAGADGAFTGCIRPENWQAAIDQARAALSLPEGAKP